MESRVTQHWEKDAPTSEETESERKDDDHDFVPPAGVPNLQGLLHPARECVLARSLSSTGEPLTLCQRDALLVIALVRLPETVLWQLQRYWLHRCNLYQGLPQPPHPRAQSLQGLGRSRENLSGLVLRLQAPSGGQ